MNNPIEFMSTDEPTPIADAIYAMAQKDKPWTHQSDLERTQSMLAAVIAWLETELPKQK